MYNISCTCTSLLPWNNSLRSQARLRVLSPLNAALRKRVTAADKVSSSVNYVHVKRIASIPCGHISYLSRTFSHCNYTRTTRYSNPHSNDSLSRLYSLSLSHSLVALSISPFHFFSWSLSLSHFLSDFATSFPINIYALPSLRIF